MSCWDLCPEGAAGSDFTVGSSGGAAAAPAVLGAQELMELWNPRVACLGLPGQEFQKNERKLQIPTKGIPGGKLQPFLEASSPPSQDKAVAKPSGPSLHPWQRAENGQERGDKAGVGEEEPCQVVQAVTMAQSLSLCLGTAVSPEHPQC